MGTYNPPVKGSALQLRIGLADMNVPGSLKSSPTIAAGDFKIDKDGGGLSNLTNLPTVSPSGTTCVLISLTATEMTADVVTIVCIDQTSPKEWCDNQFCILTA